MQEGLVYTEADAAYAAGLLDGEGSISVHAPTSKRTGRVYHSLYVYISLSDPRPLLWLQERFGGAVFQSSKATPRRRAMWRWQVSTRQAETFIRAVKPWLIVKAERADIALALRATRRKPGRAGRSAVDPLTDELALRRTGLQQQLKTLNAAGEYPEAGGSK